MITAPANPFPGLRPFMQEEADLFFGRDRQSDELVRRLASRRFLAVVGTSGSGKSSLVRAGLLPSLEGGFMAGAGAHWRIAILRPQDDPIGFLAQAIVDTGVLAHLDLAPPAAAGVVETTLRRSSLGLIEIVRLARLAPHENLLILVDQFEELFRFADLAKQRDAGDEAPAFVKLLLQAAQQTDVPVYVVITMRSDFLGDCDRFRGLPEAISESQYLIPRLSRDELQAVITGPVGVRGGRITPSLVQRLLNDVGDDMDQLPVLQHALMRAWDHWERHDQESRAIELGERPPHPVTLSPFLIQEHEVTNREYRRFLATQSARDPNHNYRALDDLPVVNVSWHEAMALRCLAGWEFADRSAVGVCRARE